MKVGIILYFIICMLKESLNHHFIEERKGGLAGKLRNDKMSCHVDVAILSVIRDVCRLMRYQN